MRHTRSHTGNRRSHHALKAMNLSTCSNCGKSHRPHHMCLNCGFYNGRQVMDLTAEKAKRDARIQAKNERINNELGNVQSSPEPDKVNDEAREGALGQVKELAEAPKK